jgi:hypothetical protein
MSPLLTQLFPLIYGICFLVLLWQAFRVMSRGFRAASGPVNPSRVESKSAATNDRTGRVTIHPELLDSEGHLTQEDLLTVRFSGDNEPTAFPSDPV